MYYADIIVRFHSKQQNAYQSNGCGAFGRIHWKSQRIATSFTLYVAVWTRLWWFPGTMRPLRTENSAVPFSTLSTQSYKYFYVIVRVFLRVLEWIWADWSHSMNWMSSSLSSSAFWTVVNALAALYVAACPWLRREGREGVTLGRLCSFWTQMRAVCWGRKGGVWVRSGWPVLWLAGLRRCQWEDV